MLEKLSEQQAKIWFFMTRGMIQGLVCQCNVTHEDLLSLIEQFNKIGPNLNIEEKDLKARLIQ